MSKQQELDEFFLLSAYLNSTRSKCISRHVGAVIALYDVRISDGYNGTPRMIKNCNEGGCQRCNDKTIRSGQNLDKCLCIHAESNAILNSQGRCLKGTTLYTTTSPCLYCAKEIMQGGITRVVYDEAYVTANEIESFLNLANIQCMQFPIDQRKKDGLAELLKKR